MKKILLMLIVALTIGATTPLKPPTTSMVASLLEENIRFIQAQQELIYKQQNAIDSLGDCLEAKLKYKQKLYTVNVTCEVKNYAIEERTYKVVEDQPTKLDKTFYFEFKPELKERPYEVVVAYFKLGGTLYYDKQADLVKPDILLGVEFFSFDKIIPFYGLSLNGTIGTRTISITLGYQMIYTKFFNNTSILLGYSYNYFDRDFYPTLGIALNF